MFHLSQLLHEKTLAQVGLSSSPPDQTIMLSRFHHPFLTDLALEYILTWRVYRIFYNVFHYVGTSEEMEKVSQ